MRSPGRPVQRRAIHRLAVAQVDEAEAKPDTGEPGVQYVFIGEESAAAAGSGAEAGLSIFPPRIRRAKVGPRSGSKATVTGPMVSSNTTDAVPGLTAPIARRTAAVPTVG